MNFIDILDKNGLLKVINKPCSIDLQIAHLSYIEIKKHDAKTLLFTNPIDENGKTLPPLVTNLFSSTKALEIALGRKPEDIATEISTLLQPKKPQNLAQKIDLFSRLFSLRAIFPKHLNSRGACQARELEIDLYKLPILKTWPLDAARFITMGQVYTKSLSSKSQNLGMYRLQIHGKDEFGMHWQIHKDAANFFNEYKRAGLRMPVSIGIGGDPLYIWCAQAPLPKNIFELMLYGFIRKSPAKLVKSLTNDIYIPQDLDYVIEGYVDPNGFKDEGPFGDHTGFYTRKESFPVMHVAKITSRENPLFYATVVGKPPLEDKFMGHATERIFLPLLRTSAPELIDYKMPENGVFHNLILAKFNCLYPAHAKQLMHTFWGVGQMSFVKHAIFVPHDAPNLNDFKALCEFVLNRFGARSLLFSEGICDQLDHASPNACYGGKLGIDASFDASDKSPEILSDEDLLIKFKHIDNGILDIKQYFTNTKNPICFVKIRKTRKISEVFDDLSEFKNNFRILIFVDENARLNNVYMLVWRVTNNIDALRDVFVHGEIFGVDATSKGVLENYKKEWPLATNCDKNVVCELIQKGLVENNEELFNYFEIFD